MSIILGSAWLLVLVISTVFFWSGSLLSALVLLALVYGPVIWSLCD